jgi:hypothetical protein
MSSQPLQPSSPNDPALTKTVVHDGYPAGFKHPLNVGESLLGE